MGSKHNTKPSALSRQDDSSELLHDIQQLITETRAGVSAAVNTGLTLLYWRIGQRIHQQVLLEKRADYGKEIVSTLSRQLVEAYGKGNLRRMIQFAEVFPEEQIVVTLSRQLSWSYFLALLPMEKPFQRDFYAEMCRIEGLRRAGLIRMLYRQMEGSERLDVVIKENLEGLGYGD